MKKCLERNNNDQTNVKPARKKSAERHTHESGEVYGKKASTGRGKKGTKRGRKRGRKRRGYSMGRNPFITYTKAYIEESRAFLAKSTIERQFRQLRYQNRVLKTLMQGGKIKSYNPTKLDEEDIRGFMLWMQERDLAVNTQQKYLNTMNCLLRWCGNAAIDKMRLNNSNKENLATWPNLAKWSGQVSQTSEKPSVSHLATEERGGDE